jgi:hypothetical protein
MRIRNRRTKIAAVVLLAMIGTVAAAQISNMLFVQLTVEEPPIVISWVSPWPSTIDVLSQGTGEIKCNMNGQNGASGWVKIHCDTELEDYSVIQIQSRAKAEWPIPNPKTWTSLDANGNIFLPFTCQASMSHVTFYIDVRVSVAGVYDFAFYISNTAT